MRNSQLDYWRAVGGSDENEFPFMEPETNITFCDRRTGEGEVSTQQLVQIEVPQSAPAGSGLRGMQESSQDRKCDC